jgi:hypothetical protein
MENKSPHRIPHNEYFFEGLQQKIGISPSAVILWQSEKIKHLLNRLLHEVH